MKVLQERDAELKKEMTSLKERNHSLEQMVNELLSKGDEGLGAALFVLPSVNCCTALVSQYT